MTEHARGAPTWPPARRAPHEPDGFRLAIRALAAELGPEVAIIASDVAYPLGAPRS